MNEEEEEELEECSVCMLGLEEKAEEVTMLGCRHGYHERCLGLWVSKRQMKGWMASCPICRALIDCDREAKL